jgi:hypothetical protein
VRLDALMQHRLLRTMTPERFDLRWAMSVVGCRFMVLRGMVAERVPSVGRCQEYARFDPLICDPRGCATARGLVLRAQENARRVVAHRMTEDGDLAPVEASRDGRDTLFERLQFIEDPRHVLRARSPLYIDIEAVTQHVSQVRRTVEAAVGALL